MTTTPPRRRGNAGMPAGALPRAAIIQAARNPSRGNPPLTELGQPAIRHLSGEGQGWRGSQLGVAAGSEAGYFLVSGWVIPGLRVPGSTPGIKRVARGLPALSKDDLDSDLTPPTPECEVGIKINKSTGRQKQKSSKKQKKEKKRRDKKKQRERLGIKQGK